MWASPALRRSSSSGTFWQLPKSQCRKSSLRTLRVYTMVWSISIPEKYFGSCNLCGDIEITHYILTDIPTYGLSFVLTPFLTWVPAFDSLIMLWRVHSYKFKHAVLGRFKHSIQHSDDKIVQILCDVYLGILLATFCELCKYSKPGKPAI